MDGCTYSARGIGEGRKERRRQGSHIHKLHTYIQAEELYDHREAKCNVVGNFDACENENKADDPSLKVCMDG